MQLPGKWHHHKTMKGAVDMQPKCQRTKQTTRFQQPQQFAACLSATSSPNHSVVGAAAISAATSKKRCRATEDPDKVYEVERIVRAERVGAGWRLHVLWKGYPEATPEPLHKVLKCTQHPEILAEIERCKQDYLLQQKLEQN